jgi:hypothetical protein
MWAMVGQKAVDVASATQRKAAMCAVVRTYSGEGAEEVFDFSRSLRRMSRP